MFSGSVVATYDFVLNGQTLNLGKIFTRAPDDAANSIAQELAETVTNPLYSGWWRTSDGLEMGDLCERTFGNTKLLPNGSSYNLQFGARLYPVQQLWVNARGGYCALALDE